MLRLSCSLSFKRALHSLVRVWTFDARSIELSVDTVGDTSCSIPRILLVEVGGLGLLAPGGTAITLSPPLVSARELDELELLRLGGEAVSMVIGFSLLGVVGSVVPVVLRTALRNDRGWLLLGVLLHSPYAD